RTHRTPRRRRSRTSSRSTDPCATRSPRSRRSDESRRPAHAVPHPRDVHAHRGGPRVRALRLRARPRHEGAGVRDRLRAAALRLASQRHRLHRARDPVRRLRAHPRPGRLLDPPGGRGRPARVHVEAVTMNVVLALFVLTIAFATGTTGATGDVRVDQVATGSPAEKAGIQVNDIVRSIDGRSVTKSSDLVSYVRQQARTEKEVALEIERNGRPIPTIRAVPRQEPPEGEGPLGIRLEDVQGPVSVSLPQAVVQAWQLTGDVVWQIAAIPGQIISARGGGGDGPQVGGPIQIFVVTGQVAQLGLPTLLKLIGVLSVNLAVLNIVPFPGLDGGRLLFVLIAGIFRKRMSPQLEAAIHAVGFVLLLALLVVVSISDIRRVVGG